MQNKAGHMDASDRIKSLLQILRGGPLVAETILAGVHVRMQNKAGHMDASDRIKSLLQILRGGGRPHMDLSLRKPSWPAFMCECKTRPDIWRQAIGLNHG